MRKIYVFLGFLILSMGSLGLADTIQDPVIRNIVDVLKQNTALANEYGAHQRVVVTRLAENGTARRIEEKHLKTVWIADHPKNVLVRVNCKDFESPIRNSRECVEFTKGAMKNDTKPGRL